MLNRRGFIGALAGLPIAAVVIPKVSPPEVTAAPIETIGYHVDEAFNPGNVTITVHCDTRQIERELKRVLEHELMTRPFGVVRV